MKKVILILAISASILNGCKYEDGPWVSLRSAKNRLYGTYTLATYTVNGVDSLSLFNDSLDLHIKIYHEDVNDVERFDIYGYRRDGQFCMLNCKWELTDRNTILNIITAIGAIGTGPIGTLKNPKWNILRLANKDLKMKTNYNNKEYLIELKSI